MSKYKIIIPQEEPKQIKCYCGHTSYCDCSPLEEPPQETTIEEEAAKEFVLSHDFSQLTNPNHLANRCFQYGAKWKEERMYSEEEFLCFSEWVSSEDWVYLPSKGYWVNEEQEELEQKFTTKQLFEQFKKK